MPRPLYPRGNHHQVLNKKLQQSPCFLLPIDCSNCIVLHEVLPCAGHFNRFHFLHIPARSDHKHKTCNSCRVSYYQSTVVVHDVLPCVDQFNRFHLLYIPARWDHTKKCWENKVAIINDANFHPVAECPRNFSISASYLMNKCSIFLIHMSTYQSIIYIKQNPYHPP
jgi:hypothetical protein